ncbi:hypothetical protein [Burkholderia sp. IMCC1007]|uniref:hypothetical protein n=1 Tax=Burkholderia sp. IMCC1007 TaxID=3004104 RepID=UPI0022B47592|nr:hypothetical protein [Burkholderia sp. IMCC1007]
MGTASATIAPKLAPYNARQSPLLGKRQLDALAHYDSAHFNIARLSELLATIDAAKRAGVKHQAVVDSLNRHGFALSAKSFEMMLYPIRKESQS